MVVMIDVTALVVLYTSDLVLESGGEAGLKAM
jgi:hypothetical protein